MVIEVLLVLVWQALKFMLSELIDHVRHSNYLSDRLYIDVRGQILAILCEVLQLPFMRHV